MAGLQALRADHAAAVLAFELANRDYFATSISDRGDDYFTHFADRHEELLADQAAGTGAYYVCIADSGDILGRFNLRFGRPGTAVLGYRVAELAAGHGVATTAVQELCRIAAATHGVRTLRAATSAANVASQRVLAKNGFAYAGPADPRDIGGQRGSWYERDLTDADRSGS